jgi:hypothetical protein
MSATFRAFIRTQCRRGPGERVQVKRFVSAFRNVLVDDEQCAWPRARVVAALAEAGYSIGFDAQKVAWAVGLDLKGDEWHVEDGRLVQGVQHAT